MQDPFFQSLQEADGEFAPTWKPNEGEILIGPITRYERGSTRYGPCDIAVVCNEATGEEFGVWLLEFVLQKKFHELRPRVGERVGIKYIGKVERDGENPYKNFVVQVDRAPGSDASIPVFVDDAPAAPAPSQAPSAAQGPAQVPGAAQGPSMRPREPREESIEVYRSTWNSKLVSLRVEEWQVEALAARHPNLHEEPEQWGLDDYKLAISIVQEHGPGIFDSSAKSLAKLNPASPELTQKCIELLNSTQGVSHKDRLRINHAIETGWHEALAWVLEFFDRIAKAKAAGQDPDDDLPF